MELHNTAHARRRGRSPLEMTKSLTSHSNGSDSTYNRLWYTALQFLDFTLLTHFTLEWLCDCKCVASYPPCDLPALTRVMDDGLNIRD